MNLEQWLDYNKNKRNKGVVERLPEIRVTENKWQWGNEYYLNTKMFNLYLGRVGMSAVKAGRRLKIAPSTMYCLKRNTLKVSYKMAQKLLDFTGIAFEVLFIEKEREN